MLNIIRNDWYRMKEQKLYLAVAVGLTICSVLLAIVLTGRLEPKLHLAVVKGSLTIPENKSIRITEVDEEPPVSSLIQGQFDGIVSWGMDKKMEIRTAKGSAFQKKIRTLLEGRNQDPLVQEPSRKIGTNITGYMLMFLLMQGVLYARLFAEDREKRQIERVVCSPIAFGSYLAGHGLFIWLLIFLPSFLAVWAARLWGTDIGFTLWQYGVLIGLMSLLAVCFALCLNSFFHSVDTANMVGSCLVVLSSVLAGSFYDMAGSDGFLGKLLYLLPQKGWMLFVDDWEKKSLNVHSLSGLIYVIISSLLLLAIGVIKTRRAYVFHRS